MRTHAPWPQMVLATVVVMILPAVIVGGLSALGILTSLWAGVVLAVALSLGFSSAGSAYWRRHASGDVLFSDLFLWGWLRRRRSERRLGRADDLLLQAGQADNARKGELLRELGAALDAEDPYLDGHSRRVARYVTLITQRMNLPDERVERAKAAARIHDVGKLRVPEAVVHKAGRLTEGEFELMKQHAAAGGAMVECVGDPALAAAVRAHHERWDGSGYPDGLAGEQIPVEARIISVADTFDAITSARPYRAATLHVKALEVIDDEAGQQLDPNAARAFISGYSDRRGAALWAGLASIPRQVAGRLSTSPAELTGVLSAALTAPLVVVAAGVASAVAPVTSDHPVANPPAAEQQTVVAARPTGTPQPKRPSPTPPPTVTPGSSATATATATQTAGGTPTSAPPAGGVTGGVAGAEDTPTATASATPAPAVTTTEPATSGARSVLPPPASPGSTPESLLLPDVLPPLSPTANPTPVRSETATPTASPDVTPTPSAEPEPTPPFEPEPTPDPLPPLLPGLPPIFPTPQPPSHTADECKNGGWMDLGYPNQGTCIADAEKS